MIPSLDDVKFCRKRQQLEKKLVQLLKIMVWITSRNIFNSFCGVADYNLRYADDISQVSDPVFLFQDILLY